MRYKHIVRNKHIFEIFQSVAEIFNMLKVNPENWKQNKDTMYLSHMTSFLVGAKLLNPTSENKFRMYHIVYANDPTEGKVLYKKLEVSPNTERQNDEMLYVMVASFCGDEDIKELDTLPMWNMYGENATGIALLFKASDIASKNKRHATPFSLPYDPINHIFSGDKTSENKEQTIPLPDNNAKVNKETPKPILYKVHYTDPNIKTGEETDNTIDDKIIK